VQKAERDVQDRVRTAFKQRINELKKESICLLVRELCEAAMAELDGIRDKAVQTALLNEIRKYMDDDSLQLILEHEHIGIRSYERIAQIWHNAVCAAMGLKPSECPRMMPKAETIQAKMSQLNKGMLGCNPHHPPRNPGCLLDFYPVLSHVCKHTKAKSRLLFAAIRVDANLGRLFMSVTNHTDNVLTDDNPHPQLNRYQDPTSHNTMDFGVIKPATDIQAKDDVEAPQVGFADGCSVMRASLNACTDLQTLLENLRPYNPELEALVKGELETMPQIVELERKLAILWGSQRTAHVPRANMVRHALHDLDASEPRCCRSVVTVIDKQSLWGDICNRFLEKQADNMLSAGKEVVAHR
jgi:hypothetical protein